MKKKKPSKTTSLFIIIFLLNALFFIMSPAQDLYAAPFPSLKSATIEELELAAEKCPPKKRAKFSLTVHPPAFHLWPQQKVLISWWINTQNDERWIFPVYLRGGDNDAGEEVSPIWMHTINSSDLPEGLNTYYLTTYCGVAKIEVAMAPRPIIEDYPATATRGETIHITGKHFNRWDPELFREIRINEQGGSRALRLRKWSDTEITATLPEDLYHGKQKLFVVSGTTKRRSRNSEELPLAVVNRESFPLITMTSMLEDIFSKMDIHLNNYGSQRSGSRLVEKDAYISFSKEPDAERFYLSIPEYNLLDPGAEKLVGENVENKSTPYSYYINDLNMDYVTVTQSGDGWAMTFYFEKIDDELIGIDTGNTDIRAYVPANERPLRIQLDNLKLIVNFDLIAENGRMIVSQKKVKSFASLSATGTSCDFNGKDICKELTDIYEKELLTQLAEIMEATLGADSTSALFADAIEPWLIEYSIGEMIEVTLDNDNVIMNYLPR